MSGLEREQQIIGSRKVLGDGSYLKISASENSWIDAIMDRTDQPNVNVSIQNMVAEVQQLGIGTRLLQSLTAEAKNQGATSVSGLFISLSGLRTMTGVFGIENIELINPISGNIVSFSDLDEQFLFVIARAQLRNVDTAGWEKPVFIDI